MKDRRERKKSSLKTFLKGENTLYFGALRGAETLYGCIVENKCVYDSEAYEDSAFDMIYGDRIESWVVDVLDDGTAITYCADA